MPSPNQTKWDAKYTDPRCDKRLLIPVPSDMHRDLRIMAMAAGITLSELVRRLITAQLAEILTENPQWSKSFRGSPS